MQFLIKWDLYSSYWQDIRMFIFIMLLIQLVKSSLLSDEMKERKKEFSVIFQLVLLKHVHIFKVQQSSLEAVDRLTEQMYASCIRLCLSLIVLH